MNTYQQQRQQALALLAAAGAFAGARGNLEIQRRLQEEARRLRDGKLVVVICGEFKRGKSSLLNALLDESDLFPVDVDVATNLVSTITYGESERIRVLLGPPGEEQTAEIGRSDIGSYVTEQGNPGNVQQARMLVVETPNDRLQDGLVLVDTPGVGGLNQQHTDITYAFLPNADAIVFVSDALAPLAVPELDFARLLAQSRANVLYVVTKTDLRDDYETIVANNRAKLATALERPAETIPVFPVSSALRQAYRETGDREDLRESGFESLESELWRLLTEQRGSMLLMRSVTEVGRALGELRRPIQAEWEVYQQHTSDELSTLESRLTTATARLKELQEQHAVWKLQLVDGISHLRAEITYAFQEGFQRVQYQSAELLQDEVLVLQRPDEILARLEASINLLTSELGKDLGARTSALHAEIQTSTGLELDFVTPRILLPAQIGLPAPVLSPQPREAWEKGIEFARHVAFTASPLAMLGGVVGGALGVLFFGFGAGPGAVGGATIGGALAQITGMGLGAKEGLGKIRETDVALARQQVQPIVTRFLQQSQLQGQKALGDALRDLERALRDDLTEEIRRELKATADALQAMQDARKLSRGEVARRAAALHGPLQQADQLLQQVEEMAAAVAAGIPVTSAAPPVAVGVARDEPERPTERPPVDMGSWADV